MKYFFYFVASASLDTYSSISTAFKAQNSYKP
jgi:hypothetical protein